MQAGKAIGQQQANPSIKLVPIVISLILAGFVGAFKETALNIALSSSFKYFK